MPFCSYNLLLSIPSAGDQADPSLSDPALALIMLNRLISALVYLHVCFTAEALSVLRPRNKPPPGVFCKLCALPTAVHVHSSFGNSSLCSFIGLRDMGILPTVASGPCSLEDGITACFHKDRGHRNNIPATKWHRLGYHTDWFPHWLWPSGLFVMGS